MDFSLTTEQQAMVDAPRRFAQQKLKPGYRARESAGRIEREVVQEMGAVRFFSTACVCRAAISSAGTTAASPR